ncbi:MAG: DNA recombination protein RmuC [Patescibacteria group bacterium]|nr:DNA recombination protein RmuC [Patescibacteria group bacterium]
MVESVIIGILAGVIVAYFVITLFLPRFLDQTLKIAQERLSSEKNEIKTDLDNKRLIIENLFQEIKSLIRTTEEKMEKSEQERISSFSKLAQALENQFSITEKLRSTTESLRNLLSNNQLRGQFGEQVAENLLKMTGFVKGIDYELNKKQRLTETRPDLTIYLPDRRKINVDVKFPYQNLRKMAEIDDPRGKRELEKDFRRDVLNKINQVSDRNYINPTENTLDFVILFIPNEMIFFYIYEKLTDLWIEALRRKVILAGPFTFTALLQLIRQAYDNFYYQKNLQQVISYIKAFETEFEKYNSEFFKLGERIDLVLKQYQIISSIKNYQLVSLVEKIRSETREKDLTQEEETGKD